FCSTKPTVTLSGFIGFVPSDVRVGSGFAPLALFSGNRQLQSARTIGVRCCGLAGAVTVICGPARLFSRENAQKTQRMQKGNERANVGWRRHNRSTASYEGLDSMRLSRFFAAI